MWLLMLAGLPSPHSTAICWVAFCISFTRISQSALRTGSSITSRYCDRGNCVACVLLVVMCQYSSASISPKMYSTVSFARYSCNLGWQSRPTRFAWDFYQTVDAAAWQKTQQMWLDSWVARHQNNL